MRDLTKKRRKIGPAKDIAINHRLPDEEIKTLKQQMEFILGVTKTGLDIIDSEFNIRYIDPEWAKTYGDPAGKKCYEYFMDRSEVCPGCGVRVALKTKSVAVTEETLVKEGNRPIQVTTIPFQNRKGEWMVAEVNVDISERKRLEETLCKAHEELEMRVEERTAELAQANKALQLEITERKHAEEALQISEERYRTLAEAAQDIIFIIDAEDRIQYVNSFGAEQLGRKPKQIIGKPRKDLFPSVVSDRQKTNLEKVFETGKPLYVENESSPADHIMWLSTWLVPLRNDTGKIVAVLGISRDTTERKLAETALQKSQQLLKKTFASLREAVFIIDAETVQIVDCNPAASEIFGYPREEMVGQTTLFLHIDRTALEEFRKYMYAGTEERGFLYLPEFRMKRKNGEVFFTEHSVMPLEDDQGKRIGWVSVVRDITERKRAVEALQESEKKFRVLTETAASGIFIHQGEKFVYVNPASEAMSGYSRKELLTMNFWDLAHPDFRELVKQRAQARQQGEPVTSRYELKILTKNGEERWIDLAVGMINFEGKPAILGTNFDITERKRAEQEMRALEEQLRQSQKMEAVGQLGGGIAHDFNNLLTVIKGYSQLSLLDLKESDPLWGNIQEIQKATQRATDLTRQLLAFSRRQILDLKVLDLNSLLRGLDKMLRRIISEDIELTTLLAENLGRIKIDPGQFEQMILNLAVNARDAMPSGGKFTIETANVVLDEEYARTHISVTPGHYVKLSVSDTGFGISREIKEKVFEPFFTTKEKGKGTGLGLSTVYGIVKQSGGNIWVYSEPGHGTTFKIYLPRVQEELDTLSIRDETDELPKGDETVLLVEDEPLVRDLAHRLLCQQGYTVLQATNGEEALRVAQDHGGDKIHLLLTDVVMPQMGGKELADQLKLLIPEIKILYTSGYTDNAIVHHGVLDPGTHFLQKPFSPKTLSHKVREVLDRQ